MRPLFLPIIMCMALAGFAVEPVVEFVTPSIVKVRWNADGIIGDNNTGACLHSSQPVDVEVSVTPGHKTIKSDSLIVEIPDVGGIIFIDAVTRDTLLRESPIEPRHSHPEFVTKAVYDERSAHMVETANGKVTVKDVLRIDTVACKTHTDVRFITRGKEGLYGLGAHMEDYMDLKGKTLYLTQHNLKTFVPVIVSTGGYGLMFDAGCSMVYASKPIEGTNDYLLSMSMEAAPTLDYYFIKGSRPDDVVGGYRYLTGAVSMLPLYTFGYIQSRERYISSDDIINTVKEYRRRQVPLDMIVQDWNYWPQGWGYLKMNRQYYPDPKALADSVHAYDAKLMVSIWANPQYCPEADDFKERGFMLEHSVYDAFNPAARDLYWDYVNDEFFSNGFDAWWCDSSEPLDGDWNSMPEPLDGKPYSWEDHQRRWELNDRILTESLGAERACLYSLNHSKGIYEHQRALTDRKRVVNLTRSSFAGQQRYGTIVWNGDTHASWESFKQQIPSGLNYMATGNPYWTVDVGSFFTRTNPQWFYCGEFPEGVQDEDYKEYYTRMFQWATFLPILRSHGTDTPREIWQFGEPGTPYYDAILKMINIRYSLLPYNYSMAAMQHSGNYSMVRPLAFEFPEQSEVHDIKDQYMYGSIMSCPVTEPGVDKRRVYLPATPGGWYDFLTNERHDGGQTIEADAMLDRLPLFVKAGSIITTAEPVQHSGQLKDKDITVTVYPGADTTFALYEDAGDGYDFEKGEYSLTTFSWNDRDRTMTIIDNGSTYTGAPAVRDFNIIVADSGNSVKVTYDRKKQSIKL